jgi:hypothetical protein
MNTRAHPTVFLCVLAILVLTQVIGGFFLIRQVDAWCAQTTHRMATYTAQE